MTYDCAIVIYISVCANILRQLALRPVPVAPVILRVAETETDPQMIIVIKVYTP